LISKIPGQQAPVSTEPSCTPSGDAPPSDMPPSRVLPERLDELDAMFDRGHACHVSPRSGSPDRPNDLDVPFGPVHANEEAIRYRLGRAIDPDDRRDAVLAGDDGAVGHESPDLGHQA